MKKYFFLFCSLLVLMLLSSCASIAPTPASRAYWEKPFGILVRNVQTVQGSKITNNLVMHKKSRTGGADILLFGKLLPENPIKEQTTYKHIYFFDVLYQDVHSWAFIDTLDFKTDSGVVSLQDTAPRHDVVNTGSASLVHEMARFIISYADLDSILKTESLTIQYKGSKYVFDVLTFTGEDLQKIKEFIKSDVITIPSKNW